MAFNKKDLFNKAITAIEENNLFFIEDIIAFLPCDKTTFYRLIKVGCNEYNALKDMLDANKVNQKVKMRKNWAASENATLQMGLMRLISTEEERKRLSQQYHELSGVGGGTIDSVVTVKYIKTDAPPFASNEGEVQL